MSNFEYSLVFFTQVCRKVDFSRAQYWKILYSYIVQVLKDIKQMTSQLWWKITKEVSSHILVVKMLGNPKLDLIFLIHILSQLNYFYKKNASIQKLQITLITTYKCLRNLYNLTVYIRIWSYIQNILLNSTCWVLW